MVDLCMNQQCSNTAGVDSHMFPCCLDQRCWGAAAEKACSTPPHLCHCFWAHLWTCTVSAPTTSSPALQQKHTDTPPEPSVCWTSENQTTPNPEQPTEAQMGPRCECSSLYNLNTGERNHLRLAPPPNPAGLEANNQHKEAKWTSATGSQLEYIHKLLIKNSCCV